MLQPIKTSIVAFTEALGEKFAQAYFERKITAEELTKYYELLLEFKYKILEEKNETKD